MEEEYLGELKKIYVGYSEKTAKSLLHHLKMKWFNITTLEKGKALGFFRAPLDMTSNITPYEPHLDKAQLKCADMGVKAPNSKKVQIYIQQMYGADRGNPAGSHARPTSRVSLKKPKKNDEPQKIQITVEEEKESEKLQGEDTRNKKPIKTENNIRIEVYSPK